MELVGEENILGGIDRDDVDLLADVDYAGNGDRDWVEGRFLRLGVRPKDVGRPEVRRLTSSSWDYKKLRAGLSALDFRSGNELADARRPLFDPVNLYGADVRIAVVKKNKDVLKRLVADLRSIHTRLGEIPTLIIDDEADQASVNTVNPKRKDRSKDDRSAINKLLAELLGLLGRAQYIGYTATPFANVFVDPDDSEDIFPKDFIISLDPPDAYMGGRAFHDFDPVDPSQDPLATSNEKAFVRDLYATPDDPDRNLEIQRALDAFVLSGAIKLHRERETDRPGRFRHHTMLVHESVKQADHKELAQLILAVWRRAGYSTPHGMRRLHDLWRDDFLPVSRARADGEPIADDFPALREHIGASVDRISKGTSPVVVVNGAMDSDYEQQDVDFQRGDVWKILVGGAKLSRGFTIEGLTCSTRDARRPRTPSCRWVVGSGTAPATRTWSASTSAATYPARANPEWTCTGPSKRSSRTRRTSATNSGPSKGSTRTVARRSGPSTSRRWCSRVFPGSNRPSPTRCTTPSSPSAVKAAGSRTSSSSHRIRLG